MPHRQDDAVPDESSRSIQIPDVRARFADKARYFVELFDWPVFPLHHIVRRQDGSIGCSCGDRDCERQGKHPRTRHGFKDASRDPDQIDLWDFEFPHANLATPTGAASGIVVIDIDGEAGERSVADLARRGYVLPPTLTVLTGRGRHLYYTHVAGTRCSAGVLHPGIDIRGEGGQAVLPPSRHVSGAVYRFEVAPDVAPGERYFPEILPLWVPRLIDEIRQVKQAERFQRYAAERFAAAGDGRPLPGDRRFQRQRSPEEELDRIRERARAVSQLREDCGQRNVTLNREAFIGFRIARDAGISDSRVIDLFLSAARACKLSHPEAMATIQSARRGAYTAGGK